MIVNYQGRDVEAVDVEVLSDSERWNEYQLADGTLLSIKTVLISVHKAVGERTSDGEPLYMTKTHNLVKVKK